MLEEMNYFGSEKPGKKEPEVTERRKPFGIDLGTTNSAISIGIDSGDATVIRLRNGKKTMPSVVMWRGGDDFVVGQEAYDHDIDDSVVKSVKRLMQTPGATVTFKYNGEEREMTAPEVSALILKGLVEQTDGVYGEVKDVVVTVPAYFNQTGVSNTKKACDLAGLNCVHILREPTAAALTYELEKHGQNTQYAIVYDLGGGTFDVSLVKVSNRSTYKKLYEVYGIPHDENDKSVGKLIEPQVIDGDGHLGGDDYDMDLCKFVLNQLVAKLKEKYPGRTFSLNDFYRNDVRRLIKRCERAKRFCLNRYDMSISLELKDGLKIDESVSITPEDFFKCFIPVYNRTKEKLAAVLSKAKFPVNKILLMGGATKLPFLKDLLKNDFPGLEINSNSLNPDEAVARGAGKCARDYLYGDSNLQIFDVLPLAIGLLVDGKVRHLIPENSQLPITVGEYFSTVEDNQTQMRLQLYQGNSILPEECANLGSLLFTDIPPEPKGSPQLGVILTVNSDCILTCKASCNDEVKEIKLNLDTASDVTPNQDKNVVRWKRQANNLEGENRDKLLALIAKYERKECSRDEVAKFIKGITQFRTIKKAEVDAGE